MLSYSIVAYYIAGHVPGRRRGGDVQAHRRVGDGRRLLAGRLPVLQNKLTRNKHNVCTIIAQ